MKRSDQLVDYMFVLIEVLALLGFMWNAIMAAMMVLDETFLRALIQLFPIISCALTLSFVKKVRSELTEEM